MNGKPWTPYEDGVLTEIIGRKGSYEEASSALDRSVESICHRVCWLRINKRVGERPPHIKRPWLSSEYVKLKEIIGEGGSYKEAGEELNRSVRAIQDMARRLKIRGRPKSGNRIDIEKRVRLLELLGEGHSIAGCSRILDRSKKSIWLMCQSLIRDKLLKVVGVEGHKRYVVIVSSRDEREV